MIAPGLWLYHLQVSCFKQQAGVDINLGYPVTLSLTTDHSDTPLLDLLMKEILQNKAGS